MGQIFCWAEKKPLSLLQFRSGTVLFDFEKRFPALNPGNLSHIEELDPADCDGTM